jgi:hypothetical protein
LGDPRHDAARDQTGDEPHADFFAARLAASRPMSTFSLNFALSARIALIILAGRVFEKGDAAGDRRVLHVDVKHGKKNGNALAFAAHEIRFGGRVNHVHLAVAGRDDEVGPVGTSGSGSRKK